MDEVYLAQCVESFDHIDEFQDWLNDVAARGYRIAVVIPGESPRGNDVFGPIIILEQLELFPVDSEASATADAHQT